MDELGSATTALPTNLTPLVAILAAVTLVPVVLSAQKTSYDYDKTATFTAYKTYALKDGTKVGDPLIDNRITAPIESELAAKGLKASAAKPDITVMYHVAFDRQERQQRGGEDLQELPAAGQEVAEGGTR